MAQAKGANEQVIIQEESTPGVDPGTPDAQKIYFESCGVRKSRGLESSAIIQSDRNPTQPNRGLVDVAGPLNTELQAFIGLLFKAALGAVITTGAGPYTHVFKVAGTLPSLLIERGFTDINRFFKYNGCKVGRWSTSVSPKGVQKIAYDFIGMKETTGTSSFDATPTDLGKVSFDGYSLAKIKEGGADLASVISIDSLTVDNGLGDDSDYPVGNSGERDQVSEGLIKVTGKLKARFADLALYTKALDHTESSLEITYTLGDGLGSAGNESLVLKISELVYAPASPVSSGPKGVIVDLDFEGYYENSAEASAIQVTLKNSQATI